MKTLLLICLLALPGCRVGCGRCCELPCYNPSCTCMELHGYCPCLDETWECPCGESKE